MWCLGRTAHLRCGRGAHNTPEAQRVTLTRGYITVGPFPCEAEGKEETGRMNENQETL
jgi:hypothetical protein